MDQAICVGASHPQAMLTHLYIEALLVNEGPGWPGLGGLGSGGDWWSGRLHSLDAHSWTSALRPEADIRL